MLEIADTIAFIGFMFGITILLLGLLSIYLENLEDELGD